MKKLKDVEATRRAYQIDGAINTVHRSSCLVPEIEGLKSSISFLNHFLLKRNYQNVGCRITAMNKHGKRIISRLYEITEPRVYSFALTGICEEPVSSYNIEFFTAENLFIPFPAVMINHQSAGSLNQVHSYNRVLNDVFEDDEINTNHQKEASIDLILSEEMDTFILFMAGVYDVKDKLLFEALIDGKLYAANANIELPRFGVRRFSMRQIFSMLPTQAVGSLKVMQPRQSLFYGRMMSGHSYSDGSVSANHSFYDSSTTEEYWDNNRSSSRIYPFFPALQNIIRFHSISSPGSITVKIELRSPSGKVLAEESVGQIINPGQDVLEININSIVEKTVTTGNVAAFAVIADPLHSDTPTRISHQIVYGLNKLKSSINIGLLNPNVSNPPNKTSFTWGQAFAGGDYDTMIGISAEDTYMKDQDYSCHFTFYSTSGKLAERNWHIPAKSAITFSLKKELEIELEQMKNREELQQIWFTAESEIFGLSCYSVICNLRTEHCSGEHAF